ncbi:hypothetical protein SAMN05421666_2994 [Roseovarius nanhaiticus]|uniref:Uncharacterized protein n=1 Tax=Roseovarius nanhaiticus TaxID=573024 RepID=A0A1N7HGB7_9RHOB|nr:hypothetical protein SAMN05216208_2322 [Roseovarius nanhaiticus]SIS23937.1 hypothetical protein SAMN05421666_2994 [Roseovarius nanhaiticus]
MLVQDLSMTVSQRAPTPTRCYTWGPAPTPPGYFSQEEMGGQG